MAELRMQNFEAFDPQGRPVIPELALPLGGPCVDGFLVHAWKPMHIQMELDNPACSMRVGRLPDYNLQRRASLLESGKAPGVYVHNVHVGPRITVRMVCMRCAGEVGYTGLRVRELAFDFTEDSMLVVKVGGVGQ